MLSFGPLPLLVAMPKVLIAAPFPPDPLGFHGGTQVIGRLIDALADTHSLAVAYLRADGEPPMGLALARRCAHVVEIPRQASGLPRQLRLAGALACGTPMWVEDWNVPAFRHQLRRFAQEWRPDVVQFEFHTMAQYADALVGLTAATVLVVHEPGAAAAEDRHQSSRGWRDMILRRDTSSWRNYERGRLAQFDRVVCFTERDRRRLLELQPAATHISVIAPCGPRPQESPSPGSETETIFFVGSYKHPPNLDAALRLVRSIFPRVLARFPQAVLQLAGDAPPAELLRHAGPQVQIPGRLPDLTKWLREAALVVAPLRTGGGIRIKMMDALAFGKAIVATPLACEGLSVRHGEQLLECSDDADFADAICELLGDRAKRQRLGAKALARAGDLAASGTTAAAFEELYKNCPARSDRPSERPSESRP